jgi:uncharacterized protein
VPLGSIWADAGRYLRAEMAEWTAAFVNKLPDASFLYISPGGSKDADGRTTPRSLRHFPVRGADGAIDLPHLRNAIARIPQASIPAAKKAELQAHAEKLLAGENGKKDSKDLERVYRLDLSSGTIGAKRQTPQGGLVADANLTRTGVFEYKDQGGGIRRELRHPDEVFHPESMATYPLAPVTVDHPGRVGPHNWKEHAVGTVGPTVRQNGHFVTGELHIQHQDAMERAELPPGDPDKLQEISCGYHCDVDPTPGVYKGIPYDVAQKNIRINHVAVGPAGWGRMGPETRMHLDAGAAVCDSFGGDSDSMTADSPEDKSAKARAASNVAAAARKPLDMGRQHGDPTVATSLTPQGTYGHSESAEKSAGEAHLAAARSHLRAARVAKKAADGSLAAHHEQHAAAHMNSAADHAKAAGQEWDSEKRPLNAAGKFDASDRTDGAPPYVHADHQQGSTMTPEEKAAFDKAQQEAAQAKADAEKLRKDAADAKLESEKALAKVKEQDGALSSLQAQVTMLSRQVETRSDALTAEQRRQAEAKQQADVEELIGVRADARMVFASVEDPEGKNWKHDGKNAESIRREIIAFLEPTITMDSSCTGKHLTDVYNVAISNKRRADKERAKVNEVVNGSRLDGTGKGKDEDEEEEMDAAKAYKDMAKRKKDAWKMPKKDRGRGGRRATT